MIAVLAVAVTVAIVFMERSQRRLLVQYPKRQEGNRMFGGDTSFLPLKINTSGVIPPIFASSLLLLPATAMGFLATADLPDWLQWLPAVVGQLQHGQPLFMVLYGAADHLLLLLLHLGRVQSRRDGGEPAQVRRLPAGHPPGQADGRVSGLSC